MAIIANIATSTEFEMIKMSSAEAQNSFGKLLDTAQHETVAVTRHGRPTAFVVGPREMEELLDARRRRGKAVAELEAWSERVRSRASTEAAALTQDEASQPLGRRLAEAYSQVPIEQGLAEIEAAVKEERKR